MNYPIVKNYLKYNRSYQALTPVGAVVHSTDDAGATDEAEQGYFNSGYRAASAHAFIDEDSITETIPLNEVAWGSGPTSNHRFLQVELCEPKTHDTAKFQEIWNRAVFYFAYCFINVIKITTITKDNLMSHAEVSAKWHETDHDDPNIYFKEYGKTVDDFRAAVQAEINNQLEPPINVKYQAHVQNIGWQISVSNGDMAGTTGQNLRMESLSVTVDGLPNVDLTIESHVQNIGWQGARRNGEPIGTVGRGLRLEAVKISLVNAPGYHIQYQAHVQNKGWMDWVQDGAVAGTTGEGLRLEAIRIKIIKG